VSDRTPNDAAPNDVPPPSAAAFSTSEDELLRTIRRLLSGNPPGVVLGPGDDAALVELRPWLTVLTVDMLVEGVDFETGTASPRDIGYKSVVVNVSDVAAMGGSPRYGLVALGLPSGTETRWVVELFGGMREAADEHGMSLVGGDLSRAGQLVISVTIAGEVAAERAVRRSGARAGDRVVVTGSLGGAAGGLALARSARHRGATTDWGHALLARQFRPLARVGEGQSLAGSNATAMIDISDGLAKDLGRLCRESAVGAVLRLEDVPVDPALQEGAASMEVDAVALAMTGGEDFELVATLPPEAVADAAERLFERHGTRLTDIGEIRAAPPGLFVIGADGVERPLAEEGWDHFAE
jgi:thiamine-monophosphate kinase